MNNCRVSQLVTLTRNGNGVTFRKLLRFICSVTTVVSFNKIKQGTKEEIIHSYKTSTDFTRKGEGKIGTVN